MTQLLLGDILVLGTHLPLAGEWCLLLPLLFYSICFFVKAVVGKRLIYVS